jgi:hypothetical protein
MLMTMKVLYGKQFKTIARSTEMGEFDREVGIIGTVLYVPLKVVSIIATAVIGLGGRTAQAKYHKIRRGDPLRDPTGIERYWGDDPIILSNDKWKKDRTWGHEVKRNGETVYYRDSNQIIWIDKKGKR